MELFGKVHREHRRRTGEAGHEASAFHPPQLLHAPAAELQEIHYFSLDYFNLMSWGQDPRKNCFLSATPGGTVLEYALNPALLSY